MNSLLELNLSFDSTFQDLNGDVVLIKMQVGESILDGTLTLEKIVKSSIQNVSYILHFLHKGKSKKVYLLSTLTGIVLVGHLGKQVDWLNQVLRDIEGKLILDSVNSNNPFHSPGIETIIAQRY